MFTRSMRLVAGVGALVVIGATLASAGSAFAAKRNASTAASSITLDTSSPHLGGDVWFTTNATGLAGWEWPMVAVSCDQGGSLVYMALDAPGAAFLLGGGSSLWLQRGGEADCVATLYAYGARGGQESIRTLASVSFHALGAS